MSDNYFELRTLTFIDSIQPQLAKHLAKIHSVSNPESYDAALLIEVAPAMKIHNLVDIALKNTKVRLRNSTTERHFGLLEVHHSDQGEVKEAGKAILRNTGLDENCRSKIDYLSNYIIRAVEEDHAALFNSAPKENKVIPGESVLILETTPAAYLAIACNEALKAANIKLIELKTHGASGRLVMCGEESELDSATEAAIAVLEKLNVMQASRAGSQL